MTSPDNRSLCLPEVTGVDPVSQTAAAATVIQAYSTSALRQAPDDLTPAIITAGTNSERATEEILPPLHQLVVDLLSAANSWACFAPDLERAAAKGDWASLAEGLCLVTGEVSTYKKNADDTTGILIALLQATAEDVRVSAEEYRLLCDTSEVSSEVAALDAIIDAQNFSMPALSASLVAGALAAEVEVIFVTGLFGAAPQAREEAFLANATAPGIILESSIGLDVASRALRDAIYRKTEISPDLVPFKAYECALSTLNTIIGQAVSAVKALADAWNEYDQSLSSVVSELKRAGKREGMGSILGAITVAATNWPRVWATTQFAQMAQASLDHRTLDLSTPGSSIIDALSGEVVGRIHAEQRGMKLVK